MCSEVQILYQDESIVVVFKPTGMLVHRGMGAPPEERFLLQTVRDMIGAPVYPVHRLDRPTSGIIVFGLNSEAANRLQVAWQSGTVVKLYQAIVRGWLPEPNGVIEIPLDDPDSGIIQDAYTSWKVLDTCTPRIPVGKYAEMRLSLVDLFPRTGRYHQLRRHFARIHHPILGDTTHGDRHHNHTVRERFGWWRLMLWAHHLEFPHPVTGEIVVFDDDPARGLDKYWQQIKSFKD